MIGVIGAAWQMAWLEQGSILDLSEYDFIIENIPGTSYVRADTLSRRADYTEGREDNNDVAVLLTPYKETTPSSWCRIKERPPLVDFYHHSLTSLCLTLHTSTNTLLFSLNSTFLS